MVDGNLQNFPRSEVCEKPMRGKIEEIGAFKVRFHTSSVSCFLRPVFIPDG